MDISEPETIFKIIYGIGLFVTAASRVGYGLQYVKGSGGDRRSRGLDKALVTVSGMGLVILPCLYLASDWLDFANYDSPVWVGAIGAVVFAIAVLVHWRSQADLGRNWSPHLEVLQEHSLITEGVYRYVRHPMYAAYMLWGVGQALLLPNWLAGPSMIVTFLPLYFYRVGREEQMLLEHFGGQYRRYMERTGRVLPPLWRGTSGRR